MNLPYKQIALKHHGAIVSAHIRQRKLDEPGIELLGDELTQLIEQAGCRQLVLSLGPGTLECLYSVFMAKLVMVHRRLHDHQGALILCDVTPEVMSVFEACRLQNYFLFSPDVPSAVATLNQKTNNS